MKTLYESLLGDMEANVQAGDDFLEAAKELDVTKKLTIKDLEINGYGEIYYILKCPKFIKHIGINEKLGKDFDSIKISSTIYEDVNYFNKSVFVPEIDAYLYKEPVSHQSTTFENEMTLSNFFPKNIYTQELKYSYSSQNTLKKDFVKLIKNTINSKNIVKIEQNIIKNIK